MTIFFNYSNTQLLEMVDDCKSWDSFPFFFQEKIVTKINKYKFSSALRAMIEYAGIPIDILWMLLSFVTLGVATFWIAGFIAALSLIIATGAFVYTYQHKILREKANAEYLDLAMMKIQILNEVLERQGENNTLDARLKSKPCAKMPSIVVGISVTSILAFTFYWGLTDILMTVGLMAATTAVTGPIGLAIAFSVAIIAGIYFGIKHYQATQSAKEFKNTKKNFEAEISRKRDLCSFLEKKAEFPNVSVVANSFFKVKNKLEITRSYSAPCLAR